MAEKTLRKILIIRFSSIGDIVLTTPVIRCLKKQLPHTQIHFVCKAAFADTLKHNPYIDKLHTFKDDVAEIYNELTAEKFDRVIDLHRNLRSLRLRIKLKVKSHSFDKINLRKFLAVRFKMLNLLPDKHIVDRYFEAVASLGVISDKKGLDYFYGKDSEIDLHTLYNLENNNFTALVAGGSYFTKRIPLSKLIAICKIHNGKVALLGGKEDISIAQSLQKEFPDLINLCGSLTLNQSAYVISAASKVISSDTGLMHIAAAYHKPLISIWGNTVPEFGMSPYLPHPSSKIIEVNGLKCRPCSKLGYRKCPQGHFRCMLEIDVSQTQI